MVSRMFICPKEEIDKRIQEIGMIDFGPDLHVGRADRICP